MDVNKPHMKTYRFIDLLIYVFVFSFMCLYFGDSHGSKPYKHPKGFDGRLFHRHRFGPEGDDVPATSEGWCFDRRPRP